MKRDSPVFIFMKKMLLIFGIAFISSASVGSLFLFAEMETMSPSGNRGVLSGLCYIPGFLLIPATLLIPCSLLGMIFKRSRKTSLMILIASLTFVYCTSFWLGRASDYRMAQFRKCAERSKPLVKAIHAYQEKFGKPPETLKELVPEFLEKIPSTGINAYPDYDYVQGRAASSEYEGNPWALVIETPENVLDFSSFYYVPNQNYPNSGHGGWIEKIGDWAYVHE